MKTVNKLSMYSQLNNSWSYSPLQNLFLTEADCEYDSQAMNLCGTA